MCNINLKNENFIQQYSIDGFKLKAVLFDLDGTILDTEPIYKKANINFLSRYDIIIPDDSYHNFVGIGARSFIMIIQEKFGLKGNVEDLMMEMDACYLECLGQGVSVFSGVLTFAQQCKDHNIPIAIASGSTPTAIRTSIKAAGLEGFFPVMISANQVARGKPYPDVFLEAAHILQVDPKNCLVLEDSNAGIQAGLTAGMTVLALPNIAYNSKDFDNKFHNRAHFIVPGGAKNFIPQRLGSIFIGS